MNLHWVADSTLRLDPQNLTVLGGSPLKLLRLSRPGFDLVDQLVGDARRVSVGTSTQRNAFSAAEVDLVDRLVDNGMIHPVPSPLDSGTYPSSPQPSDVTIVIPVKGDDGRLAALLESLATHTPDLAGVIVVDDGSDEPIAIDPTGSWAGVWAGGVQVIRRERCGGPGVARNSGVAYVATPLVMFLDSDCTPTDGWLWPLLAQLADQRVAAVASRVTAVPWFVYNRRLADYDESHSPLDLGPEPARVFPLTRVAYVPTAALMIRVDIFRDVGGFDPTLRLGEDVDLVWRLVGSGARIRYESRSVVHHTVRPDLSRWVRQRFDYGTSAAPLADRHGFNVAPAVMSRWSLAVWILILSGHRRLGALLVLATTAALPRKLNGCTARDAVRLVLGGHFGAGRQLAKAGVRVWWPILLIGSLVSKRFRVMLGAAIFWSVADKHPSNPADASLALLDDMSYGAGVWAGCWRSRSLRALLPRID